MTQTAENLHTTSYSLESALVPADLVLVCATLQQLLATLPLATQEYKDRMTNVIGLYEWLNRSGNFSYERAVFFDIQATTLTVLIELINAVIQTSPNVSQLEISIPVIDEDRETVERVSVAVREGEALAAQINGLGSPHLQATCTKGEKSASLTISIS